MNESEPCAFVVDRGRHVYDTQRGPCANWATGSLGGIPVCPAHLRKLENSIKSAIQFGSRRPADAFEDSAQWFQLIKNAVATAEEDIRRAVKAEREATRRAASVVYFMEREGFVKIGYTATLANRQRAISKGSCLIDGMTVGPVRLLAAVPGGRSNEDHFHDRFDHLRIDGEWFLLDDELWTFITGLKGYTGEPRTGRESAA